MDDPYAIVSYSLISLAITVLRGNISIDKPFFL